MARIKDVLNCNFMNLTEVKKLADNMARVSTPQTVYKHPARPNYNITHTARKDLYEPEWVVYQTPTKWDT